MAERLNMAEKLGLGPEVRELKLGASFTNPKDMGFHTIRYDFKPASVDINKMATLDVGSNSQVTVTVPPNTVFKGNSKPYQKQCIVIINRDTREITLEKLSCNIQVKKIRSENRKITTAAPTIPTMDQFNANHKTKKSGSNSNKGGSHGGHSGKSGSNAAVKAAGASSSKTKPKSQLLPASLSSVVPKHSPLHASPNRKSPNSARLSPNRQPPHASLPRFEDFPDDAFPSNDVPVNRVSSFTSNSNRISARGNADSRGRVPRSEPDPLPTITIDKASQPVEMQDAVGVLSDTSSSSSSSSSSDSSDSSDSDEAPNKKLVRPNSPPTSAKSTSFNPVNNPAESQNKKINARQSGPVSTNKSMSFNMPSHLLNEDLQLSSESASDSD